MTKIKRVLVANRGVPAVRIMHTCRDRKKRPAPGINRCLEDGVIVRFDIKV